MRWAMMTRILDICTTCGGAGGTCGAANVSDVDGAEGEGGAAAEPTSLTWRSTSCLVMRPSEPVPEIRVRSRFFSLAMRRTSGEDRTRRPSSAAVEVSTGAEGGNVAADGGGAAVASAV